jgi:hypothetical protein
MRRGWPNDFDLVLARVAGKTALTPVTILADSRAPLAAVAAGGNTELFARVWAQCDK